MFKILHKDKHSNARTGVITTDHGDIQTPIFMPVGTKATVKSLDTKDLVDIDAQIILANTYHLHLRPGSDLIDDVGGLHKFMNWDRPMLTDSGGFQVFSLGLAKDQGTRNKDQLVNIDDNGVDFRSYIDGSKHRFTPESAIEIQHKLGADIIMTFDECTPDSAPEQYAREAMDRTHKWAQRCVNAHKKDDHHHGYKQFLFGIIQGGNHKDLRIESAKAITGMDFDGIAIGGESIGYNMEATSEILQWLEPYLPEDKPRYTMGVGFSPYDLFDLVKHGVDMFDCVAPTRMARNGALYVHPKTFAAEQEGKHSNQRKCWIDITNAKYFDDHTPIDLLFETLAPQQYTRSYLHHLFKSNELLAMRLASFHNLSFLLKLMEEIRTHINNDTFVEFEKNWRTI